MGRPRKPTEILKLQGALEKNKKRYAGRGNEPKPTGTPRMSVKLDGEAKEIWDRVVPQLTELGVATELDSDELTAMCLWWSEFHRWRTGQATGRETKMAAAYKNFRTISAKFGLTPSDRANLTTTRPQQSKLEALISGTR